MVSVMKIVNGKCKVSSFDSLKNARLFLMRINISKNKLRYASHVMAQSCGGY